MSPTVKRVRKAVIPAAGMGTRFLPATKSTPKEVLPVVDKPAIQYVVEEVVNAGISDILIITGRNKRAIEDHFDRNFELEHMLAEQGRDDLLLSVQASSDLGDIHYVRQRDPLGLGHAVSVAREHVGDEPFVVLLPDDIMVDNSALLTSMLDVHERYGRSVLTLLEVAPDEISSYGCVDARSRDADLVEVQGIVEKPAAAEAPSNLAVFGRYVLTPDIFDALDRIVPGRGGELQLTDAISLLLKEQTVYGRTFEYGRHDIGQKIGFLRANLEIALSRDDLGAEVREMLGDIVTRYDILPQLISLDDARALVRADLPRLTPVVVAVGDAHGLVLADAVVAGEAVPPFANTAMDGYAVRSGDTAGATPESPVRLAVVGELPAGTAPTRAVASGEAIRIMTGAPVPDGADAIVMVERTRVDGDGVFIEQQATMGDHVRPAAGDVAPGETVFEAGTELAAAHLGVLASLDVARVRVTPRARVGVLSTGDEIVASGALAPGQIRDSNRPMLLSLVAEAGCVPVDLGIVGDDEAKIYATIDGAIDECDALLTSGAVSVGDYDFVKVAIERIVGARGGRYEWSQVAIKPAKPLAFASVRRADERRLPIFGLPGNPVSSHVSFELFARPVLRAMMGHGQCDRAVVAVIADQALARRADGKVHLDRVQVRIDDAGALRCVRSGSQASNVLSGMARANGLAQLPDGAGVAAGDLVSVMLLAEPITS